MTAICGILLASASADPSASCAKMLAAQRAYGPHDSATARTGPIAMGRALFRLLPEDAYDRQPLSGGDGKLLLVADLRLDNRSDLVDAHGGIGADAARLSDSALLLACYERWGTGLLDRIVGNFAFALWDGREEKLLLARDPLGQRPLYYRQRNGLFAFSTMPSGVLALDDNPPSPDEVRLAEILSDLSPSLDRSFFAGVSSVQPGHMLTVSASGLTSKRYWNPQPKELRLGARDDWVEAYREQLDRAVLSCLRGAGGAVGSHLSSGYDSSAVTATAARLLARENGRVVAFTSAPRQGFDGLPARGRIADESPIAAKTAALHSNIEHVVLRSTESSPLEAMREVTPFAQQPIGNVKNAGWWFATNAGTAARGMSVLLTGENGNMTISAGGLPQLADLVRSGRLAAWWREARQVERKQNVRWRGILAASWGPWIPRNVWKLLTVMAWGDSSNVGTPFLLTERWKAEVAGRVARQSFSSRPPRDSRAFRLEILGRQSFGASRKAALARWGVDERDPTSDRRLIDFCLSLPNEMLLKDGVRRPLARAALADRLPEEVLEARYRGYQSADWYERIDRSAVAALFEEVAHSPAAAAVIDMKEIGAFIDDWPTSGWDLGSVFSDCWSVLNALAAAYFMQLAEKGEAAPPSAPPGPPVTEIAAQGGGS